PLHAKLYLVHRAHDPHVPILGFVGSSNLTLAGLSVQGELNVDVPDSDATAKLARWFEASWQDQWSLDITDDLAEIIDESWARETPLPPYYVYLKMAYHLSQEARAGLSEFHIPAEFRHQLLDFQKAAVQIAAHHVNQRGGVLIGDVVGLGKTLMATALARILQEDFGWETLIICPKNLVGMWEDYKVRYHLVAHVLSISQAQGDLAQEGPFGLRRYRVVLIDESHNLRNREGARYKAIKDYIARNNSRCILLSATPYNKTFLYLSAQLRLFVPEDLDLGIKPEKLVGELGEIEFVRRHQCAVRSLAAFEKSEYADDWRELMRLYMVRRTRGFIQANYAEVDATDGRRYLTMPGGARSYFPMRVPRTVKFRVDDANLRDLYATLYS
ncbi:MAG: SNF2-related protein, partial [Ktedonobacterales bacterium]